MKRRSIFKIIAAFLASFFARFTRIGGQPELAAATQRVVPKGPRGVVSPKAQWVSPASYEVVPLRPGLVLNTRMQAQEGYEVMRLRNPAVHHKYRAKGPLEHPIPTPVQPTGPVAKANGASWQPLETFQPLKGHPELPAAGTLLGTLRNPAIARRFDVSNERELGAVVGRRSAQELAGHVGLSGIDTPTEANLQRLKEIQAKLDANYAEMEANWDARVFDPADVERAKQATIPLRAEMGAAFKARWRRS